MKKYAVGLSALLLLTGCVRKSEFDRVQAELSSTQALLDQAEAELAQLRPVAAKARQLPLKFMVDKHALSSGYNVLVFNQARIPLRLDFTVSAAGRSRTLSRVVDGGKSFILRGLAPQDQIQVSSEGYDPSTITVQ